MQITLATAQKEVLEAQHKKERDGRIRDHIKVILLVNEGWMQIQIAQVLRIPPETLCTQSLKRLLRIIKNLSLRTAVQRVI
jgi:hypothetical protein